MHLHIFEAHTPIHSAKNNDQIHSHENYKIIIEKLKLIAYEYVVVEFILIMLQEIEK